MEWMEEHGYAQYVASVVTAEDAVANVLKQDDSCLVLPSDEDEGHSPEDEMLTVGKGLCYDPTVDCDGDDFQDTVPT